MDYVTFTCPLCRASVSYPPSLHGVRANCPHCKRSVVWDRAGSTPAPPHAPAPRPAPAMPVPRSESAEISHVKSAAVKACSVIGLILGGFFAFAMARAWNNQPYPRTAIEALQVAQMEREIKTMFAASAAVACASLYSLLVWAPRMRFAESLRGLRPEGESLRAVVSALGDATEQEDCGGGVRRVTWRAGSAHIALEFKAGVCERVLRRSM